MSAWGIERAELKRLEEKHMREGEGGVVKEIKGTGKNGGDNS